ncbi:hypothetical protein T03_1109 [Trichinella britovi]|uniref:Uncharacterized protein n=1 Tax=Trichinella britovi TaxID=45882 RepID=A0A0V1D301_TRIBR|nr:hypothetical protein T03_1109 [Trichinella britovi]
MQIRIVKVCGRSILISREEYESVPGGYSSLLLTSESKIKNTGSYHSSKSCFLSNPGKMRTISLNSYLKTTSTDYESIRFLAQVNRNI